ncbi:MAG: hypothetical protein H0V66_10780 [Bdellovibrionales bacterium]|nr:hypothetical protein [Bdellovibrionales bacterium]
MKLFVFLFLAVLASCVKENAGPESALKDFVESRVGKVIDRAYVLERVSGKMLKSFEAMPAEIFQQFADMKDIKSESFKVLSKSCEDKKCFLTYSVSYLTKKDNKALFSSEVKKVAEMVEVDSKWLIADVNNIKTYHESLEPINLLE